MKIDAGNNYFLNSQQTNSLATTNNTAARAATLNISNTSSSEVAETMRVDFSNMTIQQMRSWVNDQIRNGEISLDDSRAFMAMGIRIPVNLGANHELLATNDSERFNFIQKAHDGVQAALSRNDNETLKMLESAILIMDKHQGKTMGIDARA
ncbi:hypothetical protein ABC502_09615 [Alkalimonas sp. NCh-2]|uniref:hypothetical protein n=1 Tax=Alkalimonas sp. NCh-2 TaxID=3144846 RepID=UPI0031F5F60E